MPLDSFRRSCFTPIPFLGLKIKDHLGNKRYNALLQACKLMYIKLPDKQAANKMNINLVAEWRRQDPPGRFLKYDENTGLWNDIGELKAREKVSGYLRRNRAEFLKKQQKLLVEGGEAGAAPTPAEGCSGLSLSAIKAAVDEAAKMEEEAAAARARERAALKRQRLQCRRRRAIPTPSCETDENAVVIVYEYDGETRKYRVVEKISRPEVPGVAGEQPSREASASTFWEHCFPHGGRLRVYLSILDKPAQEGLSDELRKSGCFRSYTIQGQHEPRAHFLLHEEATEAFEDEGQPGYKYAQTEMKARSLTRFPNVKEVAEQMRKVCGVDSWNVGMNPVFYRDGNDSIGFHSDDDQGEATILTLLVESPPRPRRVIVKPKRKVPDHGDRQIVLFLRAGDGYDMDGMLYFASDARFVRRERLTI